MTHFGSSWKKQHFTMSLLFALLSVISSVMNCLPTKKKTHLHAVRRPLEILQTLQLHHRQKIHFENQQIRVFHFKFDIPEDGLYRFETFGPLDTLCAISNDQRDEEELLLIKDDGGKGGNCRLLWAFPKGIHHIKVRVDGDKPFFVQLSKIPWLRTIRYSFPLPESSSFNLEGPKVRHQFQFTLRSARFIQFAILGKGHFQCIFRNDKGDWLNQENSRPRYGTCSLIQSLPKGRYIFEVRSLEETNVPYILSFQMLRMTPLPANSTRQGYLRSHAHDIYQLTFHEKHRQFIEVHSPSSLRCSLEKRLGHAINANFWNRRCSLLTALPAGRYFLRIQAVDAPPTRYTITFLEHPYRTLEERTNISVTPPFQSPFQLYKLTPHHSAIYHIETSGQPLHCQLEKDNRQKLFLVDLSDEKKCRLFAKLAPHPYFLTIFPNGPFGGSYHLQIKRYHPSRPDYIEPYYPRILGLSGGKFDKTFFIEVKKPELFTLQTFGKLDTNCLLMNQQGQKLIFNDDISLSSKNYNCKITFYLKKGSYKVRIKATQRSQRASFFWLQRKGKSLKYIQPNKIFDDEIQSPSHPHLRLLKVTQTHLYTIETFGKTDTKCYIFSPNWKRIAYDDDGGQERNCLLTKLLTPGIYPIQIAVHRRGGPYRLLVNQRTPIPLPIGRAIQGTLTKPRLSSLFQFTPSKAGFYTMRTFGPHDTKCTLLDASGKELEENDDPLTKSKSNCQIKRNLFPKTYFLRVNLSQPKNPLTPLLFRVIVQWHDLHPRKLLLNRTLKSFLDTQLPEEFLITIPKNGNYLIETHGNKADPRCLLLSQKRQLLLFDDDSGQGRNCKILHHLYQGTYILQIQPAEGSSYSSGPFSISFLQKF